LKKPGTDNEVAEPTARWLWRRNGKFSGSITENERMAQRSIIRSLLLSSRTKDIRRPA